MTRLIEELRQLQFEAYGALLLVDDASSDQTREVLNNLASVAGFVRLVVSDAQGGAGKARNIGFQQVSSKYVWFVDDDDEIQVRSLTQLLDELEAGSADVLMLQYETRWQDHLALGRKHLRSRRPVLLDPWRREVAVWSLVLRTEFLRSHGICFPIRNYGEDLSFLLGLALARPRVREVACVTYVHNVRSSSTSRGAGPSLNDSLSTLAELLSLGPRTSGVIYRMTWTARILRHTLFSRMRKSLDCRQARAALLPASRAMRRVKR